MKLNLLPQPQSLRESGALLPRAVLQNVEYTIDPKAVPHKEGYRLEIDASGVHVAAADGAGRFYAQCTLKQLRQQLERQEMIPALVIDDYPVMPVRGLHLDMSRDRVPTMAELKRQLDIAASWKVNAVILYFEHVYAFEGAEEVWKDASPFTAAELQELRHFCDERFMQMIPCQESFGHLHRWLRVDKFRPLAECPEGWQSSWALEASDPFSLCPTDPKCIEFVDWMWSQLLPNFDGDWFCIGCDETADLGVGRSKEECQKRGTTQVYVDFLNKLNNLCLDKYKRRALIDADILHLHPEFIPQFPKSAIVLDWGYRPDYDFDTYAKDFSERGFDFVLMTSNANYTCFNGRSYRWRQNINRMMDAAVKYNALGVFSSEWGDNGHWNELVTAVPGDAYFAAMAWCPETNRHADLAAALDEFYFEPASGAAQLLLDCGKPYANYTDANGSDSLWLFLQNEKYALSKQENKPTREDIARIQADLQDLLYRLQEAKGFAPRDLLALASHAKWMLLTADVAQECIAAGKDCGRELPLESRREYARRFDAIQEELIALRDDGTFRVGGREDAIAWLKRFRTNLCGDGV